MLEAFILWYHHGRAARLLWRALAVPTARLRWRLLVIIHRRSLRLVISKVYVQEDQQYHPNDRAANDVLEVLQPKLVLEVLRLILKLGGPILQCVGPLVQLRDRGVTLQDFFNIVFHDADHLFHLGLLLCHASLGHDMLHLLRSGKWLAVGPKGPPVWGRLWRWSRFGGHLRCE